ncbi:MAG: hypothetical protein WDN06_20020 [Asticcacaulis sp.]
MRSWRGWPDGSEPSHAEHIGTINRCFGKDSVSDICIALKMADDDWRRRKPKSCALGHRSRCASACASCGWGEDGLVRGRHADGISHRLSYYALP